MIDRADGAHPPRPLLPPDQQQLVDDMLALWADLSAEDRASFLATVGGRLNSPTADEAALPLPPRDARP